MNADVLLMDEARGIQGAKPMGIYIMGTVGVLLYTYEEKVITAEEVEDAPDCMRKAHRHIGEELIEYALSKIK